jgi:pimeloyl-ACP methyl ester carboxylesterase
LPVIETVRANIHYTRDGSGPPVVLLQGVGVTGNGWKPQIEELRDRFTLISIDNRGIGASRSDVRPTIEDMAADALAVANAERLEHFHLAGHSMGGVIAQQVALTTPSRVLSLALLCTFLKGKQGTMIAPAMLGTAIRSRLGTRRMRRRAFVELVLPREYLATQDRDRLCADLGTLFGRDLADQPPIVMQQLRAMGRYDASERLTALRGIPTLVLSATHDCIARPAYGRALAAAIPGARYVEIPDAGHAVVIQKSEQINEMLAAHMLAAPVGVEPRRYSSGSET